MDDLGEKMRTVQDQAREKTRAAKEKLQEKSDELKQAAERRTDGWTTEMGEWVDRVAGALRTASDALEESGEGRMSAVSVSVAEQVERLGGYLKDSDPRAMMADMEQMARRNPAVFVGTTFAAGLLLGRFLRSSSRETEGETRSVRESWAESHPADETEKLAAWSGKPVQPLDHSNGPSINNEEGWSDSREES